MSNLRRIRVRVEAESSSGPANKLCEHELSIIFDHPCIDLQDLLNYRLVNKNWRDAATRVLLSRNKCYVSVSLDGRDHVSKKRQFYKSPFRTRILLLKDLTNLMSTSPKFPTTAFHLKGQNYRYDVSMRNGTCLDYAAFPDLKRFFKCHGGKIKTLRLEGCVWKKNLVDLLFTHTPNLDCLNLKKAVLLPYPDMWAHIIKNSDCPGSFKDALIPPGDISWASEKNVTQLPLKTVHFGFEIREAQKHVSEFLLSALSNVKCLEDVNWDALPAILKLGKGHLIKSFELICPFRRPFQAGIVSAMETFAGMKPALTKIGFKSWDEIMDENESATMTALATTINPLIESSKGSIKRLEVDTDHEFALHTQLCIASPLPNLTSIKFCESKRYRPNHGGMTYSEPNKKVEKVFVYPENSSMKQYFPNLTKLELEVQYIKRAVTRLFNVAVSGQRRKGEDSIPTVDTLKIHTEWPITTADSKYMSRKFPNVRILKVKFNSRWEWNCSLWALCPLAESVTIQDINNGDVESADSFFTGFSLETCAKLRVCMQESGSASSSSMRRQEGSKTRSQSRSPQPVQEEPAMTDLSRLKLLKLEISRLDRLFVSEVTGIYAFQKMTGTKIIVSIDPYLLSFSDDRNENKEMHLAPIAPYINVVHEER